MECGGPAANNLTPHFQPVGNSTVNVHIEKAKNQFKEIRQS